MNRTSVLTCLLAGLLTPGALAESPNGSDAIEFKFNHQPGQVIRQRMTNKNVGSFKLPGPLPEQRFSQTFEQVMASTCRKINPDKSVVLDIVMEEVAMKMAIAGISLEYDTRKPDAAQTDNPAIACLAKVFSAMKGAVLSVTLSPSGHPTEVEGLTAMMKKVADAAGDDPLSSQLFQQIASSFDDDAMAQQMRSWYGLFPPNAGPYRVGDTWENQWQMKIPVLNMAMQSTGEYKLLGIEEFRGRKCAKIHARERLQAVDTPEEKPGAAGLLANMKMELTSTSSNGIAYVDFENGQVVQHRQTQDWVMSMSMKEDPDADDAFRRSGFPPMIYKMKSSVSIELLEGGDAVETGANVQAGTPPAG